MAEASLAGVYRSYIACLNNQDKAAIEAQV